MSESPVAHRVREIHPRGAWRLFNGAPEQSLINEEVQPLFLQPSQRIAELERQLEIARMWRINYTALLAEINQSGALIDTSKMKEAGHADHN